MARGAGERLRVWLGRASDRHRGLRPGARILARWVAGLAAAALVALAVVLAVSGVPERVSGFGDVFANLGRNLLTAAVLGTIAWLWLYSWTSRRATRRLREDARQRPQDFFPIRPRVGSAANVVGRDQLVVDIATNLNSDFRAGPQVIVGETGSGKTSVLLKLAAYFADRDVLPILLSLRGLEEVDLAELARARFREYIDPHLRTAEEADKLWRWMSRRGKIVVLADDLDRALLRQGSDPYKLGARLALDRARRHDLPTVVASRPQGVPADLAEPPIELGPLDWGGDPRTDLARAVATVIERAGKRNDAAAEQLVSKTIDAGDALSNVFYIDVITNLLRAEELREPPAGGEHAVRIALLDAWRETVRGDRTVPQAVKDRRETLLRALERFAAARLVPPTDREEAAAETSTADDREWAGALRFGELAGITEVEDDGSYRFTHDVFHAYFAAAVLPSDEVAWRGALSIAPDTARVQLALVLAAARSRDARFCEAVCDALLGQTGDIADEQRLLRAVAAAEVARAGNAPRLDDRIADACIAARGDASVVTKRAAVGQLAELTGERALFALWDHAGDADYGVRWMAVETLVERFPVDGDGKMRRTGVKTGGDAYAVLAGEIRARLKDADRSLRAGRQPDDWKPEILPLKHMAWMLPSLRTRARAAGDVAVARLIDAHLSKLLRLEANGVTAQKGLEASIAQGFKADARMHRGTGVDDDVRKLVHRRDAFWYSQLNLVHAVTLRAERGDDAAALIAPFTTGRRHPFVKATAHMCKGALERQASDSKGDVSEYVWDDESVVISRRPGGLAPAAIQLVGDIVVLLNLNETGSRDQREAFGRIDKLPHCMGASRTRKELFDERTGCRCEFQLCPYRPAMSRMSAHREISRPFCLHQRLYAKPANARQWNSSVRRKALRIFWRQLGSLADA